MHTFKTLLEFLPYSVREKEIKERVTANLKL